MHILHLIDSLSPGGAERMLVDIANATLNAGHRVSVCVTRSNIDLAPGLDSRISLLVLNRQKRIDVQATGRLQKLIRDGAVDVLHVHGRTSLSFIVFARTLGMLSRRIPVVMHDHYGKIEIDFSVPRWFSLWGRHFVSAYVGVSPRLGEWAAAAGLPQRKIYVIENALDLARLRPEPDSSTLDVRGAFGLSDAPVGILVCGIRREKGVDLLIDAVARQTDPVNLIIVGPDTDKVYAAGCREQVSRLGLEDRVVFAGVRSDVPALLNGCDFAVMPSRSESGPLTLIEYLCARLPVVSTRAGSIGGQAARAGVEGFVPPDDVAAFADSLDQLLHLSPAERQARGERGERIASQLFDILKIVPRWIALYQSLLSSQSNAMPKAHPQ